MPVPSAACLPYTLAFLVPEEGRRIIRRWQRHLAGLCDAVDDPGLAHLTVKYLGYRRGPDDDRALLELVPMLTTTVRRHLPLRIRVHGIDLFWSDPSADPVVFLRVLDSGGLRAIHEEVLTRFGDRFRFFPHAEGDNFLPHITLSKKVRKPALPRLQRLINGSRRTAPGRLVLREPVLLTPSGVHPLV